MPQVKNSAANRTPEPRQSAARPRSTTNSRIDTWFQAAQVAFCSSIMIKINSARKQSDALARIWTQRCREPASFDAEYCETIRSWAPSTDSRYKYISIDLKDQYINSLVRPLTAIIPSSWHDSISLETPKALYTFCAMLAPLFVIAFWLMRHSQSQHVNNAKIGGWYAFAVVLILWVADVVIVEPGSDMFVLHPKTWLVLLVNYLAIAGMKRIRWKVMFHLLGMIYIWHCFEAWTPRTYYAPIP